MRNLKRALSLALATVMTLGLMVVGTGAAGYDDVTSEDNQEAIEVLQAVGIMTGDENGNFNPDNNVTRNEMAVIMANLLNLDYDYYRGVNPFTDVPSWAAPYVAACAAEGVVAGIGDGLYGGDNNVTAAQAALMILKALGYFQYQDDFGSDWQVATVRQASQIGLFSGVNSNAEAALTRNQVAQLVLNGLKKDMVEFTGDVGTQITIGDTTVNSGYRAEYTARTSADDKYGTLIGNTTELQNQGQYIIQLGEELFDGDLTEKGSTDAFGRPSTTWRYDRDVIGTYADKADATYTAKVELGDIYKDLGLDERTTADYVVDGNGQGTKTLYRGNDAEIGGNGVLIEAYVDSNDDVTLVEIRTYVAEVATVDEDDDEPYITLADLGNGPADNERYETSAFDEEDIVLYTFADEEIQSVVLAEQVSGTVDRVNSTKNTFEVDGTTYKQSAEYASSANDITVSNVGEDAVFYVDAYGYVVYVDEATGSEDYAYVIDLGQEGTFSRKTYMAQLLLTDGTVIEVETDKDYRTEKNGKLNGHIVSYTEDDDEYTLEDASNRALATVGTKLTIDSGVSRMSINDNYVYANSQTIFLLGDEDDDGDVTYEVYTGIKNVPTIEGVSGTEYVLYKDGNTAKVIYIENADVQGTSTGDITYILGGYETVKDSDGTYNVYDAVVDGEVTTVQAATTYKIEDGDYALGDVVKTNSKGYITDLTGIDPDEKAENGYKVYTGTKRVSDETIGIGSNWYTYSDDVLVVKIEDGELSISSISGVKNDTNDSVVAVFDDGVVVAMFITVKDGNPSLEDGEAAVSSDEELEDALQDEDVDTITLYSGEYTFPEAIELDRDLTIIGEGNVEVGNLKLTNSSYDLYISGVNFVVDGGYGMNLAHSYTGDVTIEDCTFTARYGIYVDEAGTITVRDCTFDVTVCPFGWTNATKVVFKDNEVIGAPDRPYIEDHDNTTKVDSDYPLMSEQDA